VKTEVTATPSPPTSSLIPRLSNFIDIARAAVAVVVAVPAPAPPPLAQALPKSKVDALHGEDLPPRYYNLKAAPSATPVLRLEPSGLSSARLGLGRPTSALALASWRSLRCQRPSVRGE
jgi:hypothetical protein